LDPNKCYGWTLAGNSLRALFGPTAGNGGTKQENNGMQHAPGVIPAPDLNNVRPHIPSCVQANLPQTVPNSNDDRGNARFLNRISTLNDPYENCSNSED